MPVHLKHRTVISAVKRATAYAIPLLAYLALAVCFGQQSAADLETRRIERIFALGRLWGTIRHFHPFFAYREDIDWDTALATAIGRIDRNTSDSTYSTIVDDMLRAVGDPVTRLLQPEPTLPPPAAPELSRTTEDGIQIVSLRDYRALGNIGRQLSALAKNLRGVRGVLVDLRPLTTVSRAEKIPLSGAPWWPLSILSDTGFAGALTNKPLFTPSTRRLMYTGYNDPFPLNDATVDFQVISGGRIPAGRSNSIPIGFLADPRSAIPPEAVALQAAGKAAIVAVGGATDESLVAVHTINLPGGLIAQVRLEEVVSEKGAITFDPDAVIPISESEASAIERALAYVRNFRPSSPPDTVSAIVRPVPQEAYPEMRFPSREYRLLAVFRIWSVINFFFPSKSLTGEDWDSVVRQAIAEFEGASNASEYTFAVAHLVHHFYDSHAALTAPSLDEQFGAHPPMRVEFVEGQPVITAILDAQPESGVEVGDVLTEINGEGIETRAAFWSKAVSASTPQFERVQIARVLLAGREGSTVELTLRKRNGAVAKRSLVRSAKYLRPALPVYGGRTGPVYRILPGNIGYADLDRLDGAEVSAMFAMFSDTKAIIFDMRGYPQHSPWEVVGRLNSQQAVPAIIAEEWWINSPSVPGGISINQDVGHVAVGSGDYRGKTAVLIDGRTLSQAEHIALHLKAAGALMIGAATGGADSSASSFSVPGGITIRFTAALVREPNGRLIQRGGILPDVQVEPTIESIRSGRDEVLERAVEVLSKK
jgi:hypothetical protein